MALFKWSICRLNGAKAKREVLTIMAKFRLEIVGQLESRVKRKNQSKVMRCLNVNGGDVLSLQFERKMRPTPFGCYGTLKFGMQKSC